MTERAKWGNGQQVRRACKRAFLDGLSVCMFPIQSALFIFLFSLCCLLSNVQLERFVAFPWCIILTNRYHACVVSPRSRQLGEDVGDPAPAISQGSRSKL